MARVTRLMHHAIRIGKSDEDLRRAERFYGEILGLEQDPNRPHAIFGVTVVSCEHGDIRQSPHGLLVYGEPRSGQTAS